MAPSEKADGTPGAAIRQKSFDAPDDVRRFPEGIVNLVHLGSVTMGRGVLQPGFRWSTSLRTIQGTSSCQVGGVAVGYHQFKGLEKPIEVFQLAT